jgi:transcriptional regulator with XRE-family HTH domain
VTVTDLHARLPRPAASRRGRGPARRTELAAFLRSRRERLTPEDVGLPPGLRRRTPGLRREEVAQLAGVGVTWYTWLEQGRVINASVQVLDAIANTLRLDTTERAHLYRLAGVPSIPRANDCDCVVAEVRMILDGLAPLPASLTNERFDLLACNSPYAALFPALGNAEGMERNILWQIFTVPARCNPFVNVTDELPRLVATLRAAFGRHVGEPAWTRFVQQLSAASPYFAELWARQDVAPPGARVKVFSHAAVGEIRMTSTILTVAAVPGTRINVYTPIDEESRERLTQLPAAALAAAPGRIH